ncbi:septum formation family protein [Actinomadura nitritigenes]|uniref:septum formation family protein n=1 Tax=Actinomadura nitritigenes TaxID=134602 RepID=UPI0036AC8ACA
MLFERPRRETWETGDHGLACVFQHADGQRPARARSAGSTEIGGLRAGECVEKWRLDKDEQLIGCGSDHEVQVLGVFTVPGDEWPGKRAETTTAKKGCRTLWAMTFGAAEPRAPLWARSAQPTRSGWEAHDRLIICLVASHSGTLKGSLMPG